MSDEIFVWWTDDRECQAVRWVRPTPSYLKEQLRRRCLVRGVGQVFAARQFFGDRVACRNPPVTAAGVAIREVDLDLTHNWPGFVTDLNGRRR